MNRKLRVFISVLCILSLTFTFTIVQEKEAEAFVPAVAIGVIAVGAALLTAAGIVFTTNDSAKAAGYAFVNGLTDDLKSLINNAVTAGGALAMTPALWNYVEDTASNLKDGNYTWSEDTGSQTYTSPNYMQFYEVPVSGYGAYTVSVSSIDSSISPEFDFVSSTGAYPIKLRTTRVWNGSGYVTTLHFTSSQASGDVYTMTYSGGPFSFNFSSDGTKIALTVAGVVVWSTMANCVLTKARESGWSNYTMSSTSTSTTSLSLGTNYQHDSVIYGNPSVDYSNKNVVVPTTITGVVNASPSTILSGDGTAVVPPLAEPSDTTLLGTISATLQGTWSTIKEIYDYVRALPQTISTAITDAFVPADTAVIEADFTAVQGAFADAFPFSLVVDMHDLFYPALGGLQYPKIGFNVPGNIGGGQYVTVWDFGGDHQDLSDTVRHYLTIGLWFSFAVGVLAFVFKSRGGFN